MFSYQDLDNNPALRYRVRDNGTQNWSAFFSFNNVRVAAGQWLEFDASELNSVYFHAALIESSESISFQAYDGRWSNLASGNILTVNTSFFAPEITTTNGSILSNEVLQLDDLYEVTDRDGDAIEQMMFVDRSPNELSGYFTVWGQKMPQAQWFAVSPDDLPGLRYVSGRYGVQNEQISMIASDGKYWSEQASLTVTTTANSFRPVVTALNVSSKTGGQSGISNFYDFTDQDGNTPKVIWLKDTGTGPNSGQFFVNNVAMTQGQWFSVPYNDFDSIRYHFADQGEVEFYDIAINDGRYMSQFKRGQISSIPRPDIDTPNTSVILSDVEDVSLSSLFSQSDPGPRFKLFQVIDATPGNKSARVTLNETPIAQQTVYTFNPTQFANVEIEGGKADMPGGRDVDQVLVRAFNGLYWTDWLEFDVSTNPVAERALVSGQAWDGNNPGVGFNGNKTVITYSFIDGLNATPPYPPLPGYYALEDPEAQDTTPLDDGQRNTIRDIFDGIEKFANIDFVEVPFDLFATQATITLGACAQAGSQGWAYLPDGTSGKSSKSGDIWFKTDDNVTGPGFGPDNITPGGYGILTYTHEIGHAIGLKHPFEPLTFLPIYSDFHENTVMSYSTSSTHPEFPITMMLYDVLALQEMYGANTGYQTGNDQYVYNNSHRQILWDAGGIDTLNFANQFLNNNIDLREGRWSSLNGVDNSLMIAYDTIIENARGGRGNDIIQGNQVRNLLFGQIGNDRLIGDGGNDVLRGMQGDDTYVWQTGDGIDRIREDQLGGIDAIEITDLTGNFDSLENDLTFTRVGADRGFRDLRIDLTINRGASQGSIFITDQAWGGSRVETLRFMDSDGNQIGNDIDLESIYTGATNLKQQFRVTEFETSFGFIAVPV
ncbi:MAG: M10 family metallopeptidase C-terminal domain-containing protein [Pirellulaceae bacterium]